MPNIATTEAVPRCKCGGIIELSKKVSYDGHILGNYPHTVGMLGLAGGRNYGKVKEGLT